MVIFPAEDLSKREEEKIMEESAGAPYGGEIFGDEESSVKGAEKTEKTMPVNPDVAGAFARLEKEEKAKKSDISEVEIAKKRGFSGEASDKTPIARITKLNVVAKPERKKFTPEEDEKLKKIADAAVLGIEEMAKTLIKNNDSGEELIIKNLKEKIYNLENSYNVIITIETFNRIGEKIYDILSARGGDAKVKSKMLQIFNKLIKQEKDVEVRDIGGIIGKEPTRSEIDSELRRIKEIIEKYKSYYKTLQALNESRTIGEKEKVKKILTEEIDSHVDMVSNIKNEDIKKEIERLRAVRDYISKF